MVLNRPMRSRFLAALAVLLPVAASADPALSGAYRGAQLQVQNFKALQAARQAEVALLADPQNWRQFPAPDAQTLAWLSSRIPDLDAANVRTVPLASADALMQRAAAAQTTYLDLFSDPAFGGQQLYYAPVDVLNAVHAKYLSGAMPIQGTAEDGQPYQIQAIVAGQGKVEILYERGDFSYKENNNRFKVAPGARVSVRKLGPGDIALEGLSAYGAAIICPWAKIQRMTMQSAHKMRVETSCGSRNGIPVRPVRVR